MAKQSFEEDFPVGATLKILGGKWKILILCSLSTGKKRFNELRRVIPGVTQRMLTNQLRELEKDKIITRKVHAQVPPKVEYSLTEIGKTVKPLLMQLEKWGICYLKMKDRLG